MELKADSSIYRVREVNLVSSKQGFARFPKGKHRKVSSLGGRARVPKGTAMLSPEQRTIRAREAANILWTRRRQAQEAINSQEDGRLNDG